MSADNGVTDRDKLSGLFLFAQGVLAAKGQVLMRMQDTQLGYFPEVDIRDLPGVKFESDDETWMRLDRLRETVPPALNETLSEWVEGRFDDPDQKPSFKPVIVREAEIEEISDLCEGKLLDMEDVHLVDDEEIETHSQKIALRLENLAELHAALKKWRDGPWEEWACLERPIRKSINLYNNLFKLHNMMHGGVTDTPPELVWGIGIARWRLGSGQINMPLLEQLVDLEVQKGGTLCIRPREVRPSFSLKPFLEADIDGSSEAQKYLQERFALIAESDDTEITPFDTTAWENLLDAAATRLSSRAKHVTYESIREGAEITGPTDDLTIYSSWAIYGRPRSESLREQDLERLRTKIEAAQSDDILPKSMRGFVAPKPEEEINVEDDWGLTRTNLGGSSEPSWGSTPIKSQGTAPLDGRGNSRASSGNTNGNEGTKVYFFPLAYNDEQSQIIDRLETEDVVTVTGPPGTGKTHTIANIISHYMATGRRVLVTARTAEAIAAVREKLPAELASLVIASVASDRKGVELLQEAIQKLSDDVVTLNIDQTKEEIGHLEDDVVRIDRDTRECDRKLSSIAATNLAPLTWNGEQFTAMQLAATLAEIESEHSWMIDRPSLEPPATLEATLDRLREALPKIGGDVVYIRAELPNPAALPSAAELIAAHKKELDFRNRPVEDFSNEPVMARDNAAAEETATDIYSVIDAAQIALEEVPGWERNLVAATIQARLADEPTTRTFANILKAARLVENRQAGKITYALGDAVREKLIEAVARAQNGSRPVPMGSSIFYRNLVTAIESVRLNGSIPKEPEEWKLVYDALKVEDQRPQIEDVWGEDASAGLLPDLPSSADDVVAAVRDAASRVPEINHVVKSLLSMSERLSRLFPYGLDVDECLGDLNLKRILKALRANMKDSYVSPTVFAQLENAAQQGKQPLFENFGMLRDIIGEDGVGDNEIVEARSAITTEILRLQELQDALSAVDRDLKSLREAGAPLWADACLADPAEIVRIIPVNWRPAWDWAVMRGRIDSIIALGNGNEWRERKAELRKSRERQFERLIRARTLLGLKRRLTGPVQTALLTYTNAIRRLGRGTGKGAVRWRKAIRAAAIQAAPAAPVWVMPEYKIAEQLPAELEDFDLVILDEASQSDITAIGALARGKKHLIVGDEKQVSPTAVGVPQNKIDVLRAEHLTFLPNKNVVDEKTSIFEIAMQMHPKTHLILREHFRCAEPIIQFSTRFYSGRLVPLRIPKPSERFDPPLIDVFVKGGERRGQTNPAEARFIVDEIADIASDPLHTHRDIAVISLIGSEQAELIERMLIDDPRVGTDTMGRLRIVCGNSRTMQGQERSVVFLSMVATPETSRVQSSLDDAQRFNVALSRARDRLYLVRSVSTYDLKPGDLKLDTLQHFENPMPEGRAITGQGILDRCESGFEQEVCRRLIDANYRVTSQVKVGPYSIDLVVEGADDRRLAIELDGDFWHGPEKWEQDMARQAVLERAGWTFWRVFGSQWMSEKDHWWRNLTNTMSTMGIDPIGAEASEDVFTDFRVFDNSPGTEEVSLAPEEGTFSPNGAFPIPIDVLGDTRKSESEDGVDAPDLPSDLINEDAFNALTSSQVTKTPQAQIEPETQSNYGNPMGDKVREDEAKPNFFDGGYEDRSVVETVPLNTERAQEAFQVAGEKVSAQDVPDGFVLYHRADLKRDFSEEIDPDSFYEPSYKNVLENMVQLVLATEGPIHFDDLVTRIARAHGFRKSGSQIRKRVESAFQKNLHMDRTAGGSKFIWPADSFESRVVAPRLPATDDDIRLPKQIAMEELIALAEKCTSDDKVYEMARLLGIKRVGPGVRERLEEALSYF